MSAATFKQLLALFDEGRAHYRVLIHDEARTSLEAAQARGTELGQGAKAMICRVKHSSHVYQYVHAVIPADQRIDFERLAAAVHGRKASLVTAKEAERLTDCAMGAVPPVSFNSEVQLIIDPTLTSRYQALSFNAGLRSHSIIIDTADYLRIVVPRQYPIILQKEA